VRVPLRPLIVLLGLLLEALPVLAVTPGEATELQVTGYDPGTGALLLSYTPACSASDHHIEFGPLQDVATLGYSGQECGIGTSGTHGSFNPGAGSFFFLIVGDDGVGIEGSYGVDGAMAERPENATEPICSFVQDLSQRCDGPFSPALDMTAFRPQTEFYGAPFQPLAVPEGEELVPGAGIRVNGDDDDGNGQPDRDTTGVAGENDLVEVLLSIDPPAPPAGFEYVLRRDNPNLRVWNEPTKDTAILDFTDSAVLSFAATTRSVWVESPTGGSGDLFFEARTTPGGSVVASDQVHFYPFTGIVMALGGRDQVPADPPLEPANHGTFVLAIELYGVGYDVHMYDEDAVEADGSGVAFNEVVSAVQERSVIGVSAFGYSQGGGSTYDLAQRLDANRGAIGTFFIDYTAYIDGVENDTALDYDAETKLPPSTAYHDNYYETVCPIVIIFIPLCGDVVPGADLNLDINTTPWGAGLDHFEIDDAPEVLQGIRDRLILHLAP
jgi:hypothetical protein